MSAFFKDIFKIKFQGSKKRFYEICYCYVTVVFNDKGKLLYYNVEVYILVQSEEDYYLIWKSKPLTIQTGKSKW